MGAFRITYPRNRIRTVLLFGWFRRATFIPAVVLVGFWFLSQVFSEMGALVQAKTGGGPAWPTGGFVFGTLFSRPFETRQRRMEQGLEP